MKLKQRIESGSVVQIELCDEDKALTDLNALKPFDGKLMTVTRTIRFPGQGYIYEVKDAVSEVGSIPFWFADDWVKAI